MAKAHVPKFGNWEKAGKLPYTQCFDQARKGRNAGKLFNPNDPHDNPEAFSQDDQPVRTSPKEERHSGRNEDDPRKTINSSSSQKSHRVNSTDVHKRGSRMSAGSDRSLEQSPLHPHNQVKSSSKSGAASPAWEKRASPNIPVRSRLMPSVRGNETPEKGSVLPKFGEWNENNPSAGEGYTDIFNIASQEKRMGHATTATTISNKASYMNNARKQDSSTDFAECTCFSWCRK